MLDKLEAVVLDRRKVYFPLKRWIAKIVSFHTHGLILLRLAYSQRLEPILRGAFRVVVLPTPAPSASLLFNLNYDALFDVVSVVRKEFSSLETSKRWHLDDPMLDEIVETFSTYVLQEFRSENKSQN